MFWLSFIIFFTKETKELAQEKKKTQIQEEDKLELFRLSGHV